MIPIGVKELNGKVENTHGFDDREFYSRYKNGFENYESLERNMRGWNEYWNSSRHTKKLGWRTPNEVLENAYVCYFVFWLKWRVRTDSIETLNENGVFELKVPTRLPTRKRVKVKRQSAVSRYLTWIEGEEKKSLKSIIAVPAMSPRHCSARAAITLSVRG